MAIPVCQVLAAFFLIFHDFLDHAVPHKDERCRFRGLRIETKADRTGSLRPLVLRFTITFPVEPIRHVAESACPGLLLRISPRETRNPKPRDEGPLE